MRCPVVTAAVALVLVGTAHDSGAQTHAGGSQQQPVATQAPPALQNQPPAPGSRFTSTLKFVPPPPDIRPVPLWSAEFLAQGPPG